MSDRASVNRLNEQLAIFRVLCVRRRASQQARSHRTKRGGTHLFKLSIERSHQLLLQESNHLLDIPTRNHLESDTKSFSSYFNIGTDENS